MERFKLTFTNLSAKDQIALCEQRTTSIGRLPPARLQDFDYAEVQAKVAAARASHNRVQALRAELKAEIANRKIRLADARNFVRITCSFTTGRAESRVVGMAEIGLNPIGSKKRPVGQPAAPTQLRGEPLQEGEVRLRWKRPVRRCTFEIKMADTPSDDDGWKSCHVCVHQKCVIKGLPSGAKVWFRIRAINMQGEGPWSQPLSVRVK